MERCPDAASPRTAGRRSTAAAAHRAGDPITPHFNQVFYTTAGLTALCLIISLGLASLGKETEASREVISGCLTMAKIGFGAIVGLIGGKAL